MGFRERSVIQEPSHYSERPVRFSMANCDTGDYCIRRLTREDVKALYRRLGHLEQMTWGQMPQIDREKAISIDKRGGMMHERLSRMVPGITTFGHFRVTGTNANTRVFVGIDRDLARVLLIDRDGELQH